MDLKGKQAIGPTGLLVIIGQLGGLHPVDVMNEMKPLGSDPVGVPFTLLDGFADFLCIPEGRCLLLQFALFVEG